MPATPVVYAYLDWRAFVRAWLAARPARSRRKLASALGCAPSFVTALLHLEPSKRRVLTDEYLERLPDALQLDPDEAVFLRLLVAVDRAEPGSAARDRALREVEAQRRFRQAHRVSVEQYELFSRWENVAILALAESPAFQADARWLRDHLLPPVQQREAQRALDLLLRLGLLTYEDEGHVRPSHGQVASNDTTAPEDPALLDARRRAGAYMHRWMLERGKRALDEFPAEERVFNAGTQLVPEERLPELSRMFSRWQAEWMALCAAPSERPASAEGRARVYRLNLQFFPLSTWVEGG